MELGEVTSHVRVESFMTILAKVSDTLSPLYTYILALPPHRPPRGHSGVVRAITRPRTSSVTLDPGRPWLATPPLMTTGSKPDPDPDFPEDLIHLPTIF